MLLDQIPWLEIWMDQLCVHVLCFPAAAIVSPFLSSLVSKSSKPGCIYLWSWSRSFDAKGKGCQQTLSAVILAELEWSTTDMSYLTLSTCPGRSTISWVVLCPAIHGSPLIRGSSLELQAEAWISEPMRELCSPLCSAAPALRSLSPAPAGWK